MTENGQKLFSNNNNEEKEKINLKTPEKVNTTDNNNNNKNILPLEYISTEKNRSKTPENSPERIFQQRIKLLRTPPTPSKYPSQRRKISAAHIIDTNNNNNNISKKTTENNQQDLSPQPSIFTSIFSSIDNMVKGKKQTSKNINKNNNNNNTSNINNNNNTKNTKNSKNTDNTKNKNIENTEKQQNKTNWTEDTFDDDSDAMSESSVNLIGDNNNDNEQNWNIISSAKKFSLTITSEQITPKKFQEKKAWIYKNMCNQTGYIGIQQPNFKHYNQYKVEFNSESNRNNAIQYLKDTFSIQADRYNVAQPTATDTTSLGIIIHNIPLGITIADINNAVSIMGKVKSVSVREKAG